MQSQTLAITLVLLIQGLVFAALLIGVVVEAHDVSDKPGTPWSTLWHPEESPGAEASFYPIVHDERTVVVDLSRIGACG